MNFVFDALRVQNSELDHLDDSSIWCSIRRLRLSGDPVNLTVNIFEAQHRASEIKNLVLQLMICKQKRSFLLFVRSFLLLICSLAPFMVALEVR